MYNILELADSTKAWADSIYQLEFSVIQDLPVDENENPYQTEGNSDNISTLIWMWVIGVASLALLIFLGWKFIGKRK